MDWVVHSFRFAPNDKKRDWKELQQPNDDRVSARNIEVRSIPRHNVRTMWIGPIGNAEANRERF